MTRVGAGLKWGDVYGVLEGKNLSVVGGRLSGVGVAGLTLGGGISYYSGLHGFACDNVKNFEVRTGSRLRARSKHHCLSLCFL